MKNFEPTPASSSEEKKMITREIQLSSEMENPDNESDTNVQARASSIEMAIKGEALHKIWEYVELNEKEKEQMDSVLASLKQVRESHLVEFEKDYYADDIKFASGLLINGKIEEAIDRLSSVVWRMNCEIDERAREDSEVQYIKELQEFESNLANVRSREYYEANEFSKKLLEEMRLIANSFDPKLETQIIGALEEYTNHYSSMNSEIVVSIPSGIGFYDYYKKYSDSKALDPLGRSRYSYTYSPVYDNRVFFIVANYKNSYTAQICVGLSWVAKSEYDDTAKMYTYSLKDPVREDKISVPESVYDEFRRSLDEILSDHQKKIRAIKQELKTESEKFEAK